jgi:cbb3-type cytochrome oxidase subunit 1
VGALRGVQHLTTGTDWALGVLMLGLLGASTLAFYAFADHAFPRILRRAWSEGFLVHTQLWTAFAGATLAGLGMVAGGLVQGSLLAEGSPADQSNLVVLALQLVAAAGLGLVALAGFALLVNVFLLYTEGRPVDLALPPGDAAAAAAVN